MSDIKNKKFFNNINTFNKIEITLIYLNIVLHNDVETFKYVDSIYSFKTYYNTKIPSNDYTNSNDIIKNYRVITHCLFDSDNILEYRISK